MTGSRLKLPSLIFPFSLSEQPSKSDLYANEHEEKDRYGPILTRETFAVLLVAASNVSTVECHPKGRRSGTLEITRIRVAFLIPSGSPEDWSRLDSVSDDYRSDWWFSFLLAGFLSLLPWAVSGSIAGVLLGSWFGGEIKKRLDRVNEEGKETRVIRFRKKALLEDNVSKMRTAGREPRWESYRETQTGLLVRRIIYSVVMERKQRKLERRGLKQLSKFLFPGKNLLYVGTL